MARVWSEEHKLERWLEVELAALDAWAELGVIPEDVARSAREQAAVPTPERVRELEEKTGHDLAAFVDAVGEGLDDEGRRWLHYGLTSSDVLDTALALQVREAGALLVGGPRARVRRRRRPGRGAPADPDHGPHARHPRRADDVRAEARRLGLRARSRAARGSSARWKGCGSASSPAPSARTPPPGPELERLACERLGLEPAPHSTQIIQRDRHAELLAVLAVIASSLDAFCARDPPPRADGGPRGRGAVRRRPEGLLGDAAQAQPDHRRAHLRAGARRARRPRRSGWRTSPSGTSATSRTRPPSGSSSPTRSSPSTTCSTASRGSSTVWSSTPERMRENLDASHGLYFSQRLLLALVESGLERDDAYRARPAPGDGGLGRRPGLPRAGHAPIEVADRVDLAARLRPRAVHAARRRRVRPAGGPAKGDDRCLTSSPAARCARSTRSTTSGCCSSPPTGSRRSTSCCPRRCRTRAAC